MAPFFRRVFPDIPPGHPAGGSIVTNVSANMLAWTTRQQHRWGSAMQETAGDQPRSDTASNPMTRRPGANTAGITLIPTSVIAIRQSMAVQQGLSGSQRRRHLSPTLLVSTFISFTAGLIAVAAWQRINLLCAGAGLRRLRPLMAACTPGWRLCQRPTW